MRQSHKDLTMPTTIRTEHARVALVRSAAA